MNEHLQTLQGSLDKLETALGAWGTTDTKALNRELPPIDRAVTHLCLAKAAVALLEMHLRASGTPLQSSILQQEKTRLLVYQQKVDKAAAAWWLTEHKPATHLNVAAANRFITHAIPELSQEQRDALKAATAQTKDGKQQKQHKGQPVVGNAALTTDQSAAEATDALLASLSGAPVTETPHKKQRRNKAWP
ncbi:hypothetical protein WJX73_007422 [Symbiochloris irregularis]|uniref:Nuclear nucleic acid-binding protein C1D n=1 Tax=Symbiochloris irregularis TaxID=706552 RepID=A0AAW1P368_9CHLO